ncbi:hypothetical protein [Nonomuraea ceibae]|uniref:hypothetical protein n=1 Tax=Nonomuraea ceibae TaxID=1935170 RepID=UPI001C5D0D03|nr:hypothetical protein [Nonomuraea ceibae]
MRGEGGASVNRDVDRIQARAIRRRLRVSLAPVTCRRCLRIIQRRQMPVLVHDTLF